MLQQGLEPVITFGKRKGLLARGHADLLGRDNPQAFQHLSKLGVAHQRSPHIGLHVLITHDLLDRQVLAANGLQCVDQMLLLGSADCLKVKLQSAFIQLQHGMREHA